LKLKLIIAIISGVFFIRCENGGSELVDMSDVISGSERYKEVVSTTVEAEVDATLVIKDWFVSQGATITSLQFRSDRMFLDRFGAKSIDKYMLITPVDTILYSKWIYEDSLKVMNAFTNWISCIGDNCNTLFFGEEKTFQANPLQVLINDSTLILIEGKDEIDFKHWGFVHRVGHADSPWNYSIEQSRGAKAYWYIFVEGKRTKLEL
jgi:hypothetical protein